MKIFLPFQKDTNTYLDEIERFSVHSFDYGDYRKYGDYYDIVNIHWPEAIFDWHEPTQHQLFHLKKEIIKWKEKSLLVYTKHDESRHKGMTPAFQELFDLIETNTDVFIHLGEFSKNHYSAIFPNALHKIVPHPLYEHSFKRFDKKEARQKLGIAMDSVVVIAPGNIRSFAERDMVLKAFKKLKQSDKVLICPRMKTELKYDFRGRVKLKRFFDVKNLLINWFKSRHQLPMYLFDYSPISEIDLSLRMDAADVVLIPRKKILNSGILFLGLTFNKIVIGPATGNITEHLLKFNFPIFNPNSVLSVTKALDKGIALMSSQRWINDRILEDFRPKNVAQKMDEIFSDLIK